MRRKTHSRVVASTLVAALMMQTGHASALGLLQAYEAAVQNDPTYRAAVYENEAAQQYKVLGRANLLPSMSMSYTKNKNRADITVPVLNQRTTTHPEYDSSTGVVSLRQPLFNLDGLARYRQGVAQTNYSDAQFSAKSQDLILRLVGAYADAKFAEDVLALVTAQRDTLAEQKKVNERIFERGEGTRTDMLETQARFDVAEAQLVEARNNVTTARNSLASLVGVSVDELDGLSDEFRVLPMTPDTFDGWKAIALENNAEIIAQRYGMETAQHEISKQRAGHAPRLDFVASLNKSDSDTLTTRNQESTVRTVGLQLNIPLYSGGSVNASTSQAVSNLERARSELDAKTNQVLVELRKQFDQVTSSAVKIDAMVKSVKSARELVAATKQSVKGGVRINLDVLNAQQQVYSAQRDLAQARYNYLISYLRLRFAAGTLIKDDLHTVANYFVRGGHSDLMSKASLPASSTLLRTSHIATAEVRTMGAVAEVAK